MAVRVGWPGVVLVRHAEAVPPAVGGPDELTRPLTAAGVAAARGIAHRLAALRPAAVVSSPYLRAVQTVTPAAELAGQAVRTCWELREWDSGLAATPQYAAHYAWSWANPEQARTGGESLRQLTALATAAVDGLAGQYPGGLVVVGSHGTFVTAALAGFGCQVGWPFCHTMPMPAIYRLQFGPGRAVAISGPGLPGQRPAGL